METVTDFIFLGSKITADGDCIHEIKRHLLLGRKVMTNLDSTLKSREVTLLTKVHLVKAIVFPVVMYRCESWTIKKAECLRIGAFELWCWRRLLRVLWTARRSNQSILKEINPEYSLEGLMLKLSVAQSCLTLCNLQPTRLLCPWDFPGKDTGLGCHFLLQGIFPTQGSNPGHLYCMQILYRLSYKGSPICL